MGAEPRCCPDPTEGAYGAPQIPIGVWRGLDGGSVPPPQDLATPPQNLTPRSRPCGPQAVICGPCMSPHHVTTTFLCHPM